MTGKAATNPATRAKLVEVALKLLQVAQRRDSRKLSSYRFAHDQRIAKTATARKMGTSRSSLDRLLDLDNPSAEFSNEGPW